MATITSDKRYVVRRGTDSMRNRYATGPLVFLETDDLGDAQREVVARGGELIDLVDRQGWSRGVGWYDVSDYLDGPTR